MRARQLAAMAATAAVGVGRSSTAVPPDGPCGRDGIVDAVGIADGVGGVMQLPHAFHQPPVQYRHVEIGQLAWARLDPQSGGERRVQVVPDRARPTVGQHGGEPGTADSSASPASALSTAVMLATRCTARGRRQRKVRRVRGESHAPADRKPWSRRGAPGRGPRGQVRSNPHLTLEFAVGRVPVMAVRDQGMTRRKVAIDGRMHSADP